MLDHLTAIGWTLAAVEAVVISALVIWIVTRENLFRFLYKTSGDWGSALQEITNCLRGLQKTLDDDKTLDRELKREIKEEIKRDIESIERLIHSKFSMLVNNRGGTHIYNSNSDGGQSNQGGSVHSEQR